MRHGPLIELPVPDRPDATVPIAGSGGRRIRRVYRHVRAMGSAIDPSGPGVAYHELRKKRKELRYLLDNADGTWTGTVLVRRQNIWDRRGRD